MNVNHLGWWIAGLLIAGTVLGRAQAWFLNRYEITATRRRPRGPFRIHVCRRWYGTGAHVCLRSNADQGFRVISWSSEGTEVPHLLVVLYRGTSWRLSGEDTEEPKPSWRPVTMFAPYTVPRLRPHFEKYGRRPVFFLRDYMPLRRPSGHLGDVRDAA